MEIKSKIEIVELMKHLGLPLVAAEVGVAEGRWSLDLFKYGIEKLYLIDVWETVPFIEGCASWSQEWHDNNYKEMLKRIEPYKDKAVILKGFSYKMVNEIPDESLGLCYVDCDHTYLGTKADADLYWPKLVNGGIMMFHDYANPEYQVWKAVREFAAKFNLTINVLKENGDVVNYVAYVVK